MATRGKHWSCSAPSHSWADCCAATGRSVRGRHLDRPPPIKARGRHAASPRRTTARGMDGHRPAGHVRRSDRRPRGGPAEARTSASFDSTPSATSGSGAARCGFIRRSKARGSAASDPDSRPPRRSVLGLKVDAEALSSATLTRDPRRDASISNDPAVTLALLDADAVVGLSAPGGNGTVDCKSIGIQCALCHSTVDNSIAPGIGRRLDGWPNRGSQRGGDHRAGARPERGRRSAADSTSRRSARSSPAGGPESSTRSCSWMARRFALTARRRRRCCRPRSAWRASTCTPIPAGAGSRTGTPSSPISRCTARARSSIARLNDAARFPVAARAGFAEVRNDPDLITSKLPALQFYQLSIPAPTPPRGSFDAHSARAGKDVFNGAGRCASCHVPPLFTEPGWNLHTAAEIGIDDFQSSRSPDERYRTTPLAGLFTRQKGGFYHDGRFADSAGGGGSLRPRVRPEPERAGEAGSGRISEVALKRVRRQARNSVGGGTAIYLPVRASTPCPLSLRSSSVSCAAFLSGPIRKVAVDRLIRGLVVRRVDEQITVEMRERERARPVRAPVSAPARARAWTTDTVPR